MIRPDVRMIGFIKSYDCMKSTLTKGYFTTSVCRGQLYLPRDHNAPGSNPAPIAATKKNIYRKDERQLNRSQKWWGISSRFHELIFCGKCWPAHPIDAGDMSRKNDEKNYLTASRAKKVTSRILFLVNKVPEKRLINRDGMVWRVPYRGCKLAQLPVEDSTPFPHEHIYPHNREDSWDREEYFFFKCSTRQQVLQLS